MRHKYSTPAIVLARYPIAEGSAACLLLTPELGLVRVRVQGVRASGAKLASALQTFSECDATLVRGREQWRLAGAVAVENWFRKIPAGSRERAGRIAALLLRLVQGETADERLYRVFAGFLGSLAALPEHEHETAEALAALYILSALGLDAGELPDAESYGKAAFNALGERSSVIGRINRGIAASGL